jgi:hypothetical protein
MPYFDRFDICEAHLALENDYNEGGWLYDRPSNRRRSEATHVQLDRIKFKVGAAWNGYSSLGLNAREIYHELEERWMLGDGGYKPCACRDCFELAIGYGRPLCNECEEAGCTVCTCDDPERPRNDQCAAHEQGSHECQCEPEEEEDEEGIEVKS